MKELAPLISEVLGQLELGLDDVRLRVPWSGISLRALTRGYKGFILKAQADKSVSDSVDSDQCDLWSSKKKVPWVYQGAPLLEES